MNVTRDDIVTILGGNEGALVQTVAHRRARDLRYDVGQLVLRTYAEAVQVCPPFQMASSDGIMQSTLCDLYMPTPAAAEGRFQ